MASCSRSRTDDRSPDEGVLAGVVMVPVADVALCMNPLATLSTSVVELFGRLSYRIPVDVVRRAHTVPRGPDLRLVLDTYRVDSPTGEPVPDFCHLPDVTDATTVTEALEQLRSLPTDAICDDIASTYPSGVPSVFRGWLERPERYLARLCAALQWYWRAVFQPILPTLERDLARERFRLQRMIESGGVDLLLRRLHPDVTWDGRALGVSRVRSVPAAGARRVVLVPAASAATTMCSNLESDGGGAVRIGFAGSGLRLDYLLGRRDPDPDLLAALVGPNRARLLRAMLRPGTTTDLADEVRLAPSTVSHHLKMLGQAGLVDGRRRGLHVYYTLSDRGWAIVGLYRPVVPGWWPRWQGGMQGGGE